MIPCKSPHKLQTNWYIQKIKQCVKFLLWDICIFYITNNIKYGKSFTFTLLYFRVLSHLNFIILLA